MAKDYVDAGRISDLVGLSGPEFAAVINEVFSKLQKARTPDDMVDWPAFWRDGVLRGDSKFRDARIMVATLLMVQVGAVSPMVVVPK
jgi:hypothetical protein